MPDWGKWFGRLKKHKLRTPPIGLTPTSDVSTTVGNGLNVALGLLKEAVTGIGVPGLEAAVNGVVGVVDLIKDVRDNATDLRDLNDRISSLANTISMAPNLHPGIEEVPASLLSRINVFLSELHGMLNEVQQMLASKNPAIRTANSQAHKEAITDINTRITQLLNQFTAQGVLSIELDVAGARRDIRAVGQTQKALAVTQEHIIVTQGGLVATQNAQVYESLINAIPRVHARYNDTSTKPTRPCHPGTRTGLLQIIRKWIDDDPDATPYFWLCGEVGVGKSTVAHTIAQEQEALHRLGASFFFSRHDDSRRTPHLLFPSIAYQLARFDQGIYNALAKALKPDPDIVKRSLTEQFNRLVLQPLAQSGISPSCTVVIVIDGLDECSDPASILDVLAQGIGNVGVRLRVLISSRPYADILSKFNGRRLYHLTSETQFRNIDPQILSDDVAAYLSWSLGALALESGLPSPWPPKDQLDELIRRAAGLFIIASTYTKYIEDAEEGNPAGQLARILSRQRRVGPSPLAELDALYDQVLMDLKSKLPSEVINARDIIAFVILAEQGIEVAALASFFHVEPSYVRSVLRRLTAVILLPEDDDGNITPFHASFGEYIQDPARCTVRDFSIDTQGAYGRISIQCAEAIASTTKAGIIGVEYESTRAYYSLPSYLAHVAHYLAFYLEHSSPAQVETVRRIISGNDVWAVLNTVSATSFTTHVLHLVDAAGGFDGLLPLEGSDENTRAASLGILMISNHISEINRLFEKTTRETAEIETPRPSPKKALKFVEIFRTGIYSDGVDTALRIVRTARCWAGYHHKNLMTFKGIDVKFDDQNVPQEVLIFVPSPLSSNLLEYLARNENRDLTASLRIAMGVADGLCFLHGLLPPQPHHGINQYQIRVSEKGQPLLYPSMWILPPVPDNVHEIACRWNDWSEPREWYHWNPIGQPEWAASFRARLDVDVWDFGSVLYQIITGEDPLTAYSRLDEGNKTLVYNSATLKYTSSEKVDDWDKARYEAAVPLLLDTLQVAEAVKQLLNSCWAIGSQDRPSMRDVFERLKMIVEEIET